MPIPGSDKTARLWPLACILPLLTSGCGGEKTTSNSLSRNSSTSSGLGWETSGNADDLDLGEDFVDLQTSGTRRGTSAASPELRDDPQSPFWSIVLKTFDGDDHRLAAQTMLRALPQVAPDLARTAQVRTRDSGSMVIAGRYESRDDPEAQDDLHRIRNMRINNQPVFARVMLVRITPEDSPGQLHPHDLRTVRQKYPNLNLLYTIDVAVWLDPATWGDQGSRLDIRAEAMRYAASLRAQGHEAYFYHDEERGLSTVTVGVFGGGAIIDPTVGLLHSEVERMRKMFTPRLVNGEPLFQPRDFTRFARDPSAQELVAQIPQLVEVPK